MDLFERTKSFTIAKEAMAAGFYPYFLPFADSEGSVATFNGHKVIMLGSNNYLGLTTHPKVRAAAKDAIDRFGTSCTGSRFLNGTLELHLELERRLAKFTGKEAAIVFPTGYQTNLGAVSALLERGDYAILDKRAHACVVDGVMMTKAELKRFNHNDVKSLESVLAKIPDSAGKLVVIDGVYSMDGDVAPLPEIIEVCRRYEARLLIDDAHGIGMMGGGRGTAAHFGLTNEADLIMGTFSKSFASVGGFLAGSADIIHYIQHHARSLIFSAALPAANTATVLAALDIIENEPEHVQRLWDNTEYMRAGLKRLGYNTGTSTTPIIPLIIGDDVRMALAWRALVDSGVYTNPVVPPGVPQSLLRTSYIATHTFDQLEKALEILEVVGENMDLIPTRAQREAAMAVSAAN